MSKLFKFLALTVIYYGLCIGVFSLVSYVLLQQPETKSSLTTDDYYKWNFTLAIFLYQTILITLILTPLLWAISRFILSRFVTVIRALSGHVDRRISRKK